MSFLFQNASKALLKSPLSSLTRGQRLQQSALSGVLRLSRQTFASMQLQKRIIPTYQVYGEECAFTMKAIAPEFRSATGTLIVLDSSKCGRLLFEWVPRKADGKYSWKEPVRIALTADEAGKMVYCASSKIGTTFSRSVESANGNGLFSNTSGDFAGEKVEKVLKVEPNEDGSVEMQIFFEKNGAQTFENPNTPMSVRLDIGEYQVVKSIVEYSIPHLIGWAEAMDEACATSLLNADNDGGGGGGYNNNNNNSGGGYSNNNNNSNYNRNSSGGGGGGGYSNNNRNNNNSNSPGNDSPHYYTRNSGGGDGGNGTGGARNGINPLEGFDETTVPF